MSLWSDVLIRLIPKISDIFTIFEPKAFPRASAGFLSVAAISETAISGALVPNPTIKIPINKFGILKYFAVDAASSTNFPAL